MGRRTASAVCRRAFVFVLLVAGVPARSPPSRRGSPGPRRGVSGSSYGDGGHGVAEGSAPNGLDGFFGCLFSYEICQEDEVCVNDNLFGSCQKMNTPVDPYKYSLNENQLVKLTNEVAQLVAGGYKWTDRYTQCVLGNVLLAFELNQHYDTDFCQQRLVHEPLKENLPADDVVDSVEKLYWKAPPEVGEDGEIRDYDDIGLDLSENPYQGISARSLNDVQGPDEPEWGKYDFVNVHKYLKSRKRDPSPVQTMRSSRASPHRKHEEFLTHLTPDKFDFLSQIVRMDDEDQDYSNTNDDDNDDDDGNYAGNTDYQENEDNNENFLSSSSLDQEQKQDNSVDRSVYNGLTLKAGDIYDDLIFQVAKQNDDPIRENKEYNFVEEEEEEEKRSPFPWSDQVDHDGHVRDRYMAYGDLPHENGDNYQTEAFRESTDYVPDETLEADSSGQSVNSEENYKQPHSNDMPVDVKPNLEQIFNSDVSNTEKELRAERGGPVSTPVASTTSKTKYDIVDASYAYLSVLPKTDSLETARNLIAELQELLHLPSDSFSDLSVSRGDINFRINENPKEHNASSVALLALSSANELKNRTGFQIVGAGIGHVSEAYISVEDVKTNRRKYFLLTFTLCGVIAGVVLAVILLYVIRRHRLSQEKLARLAHSTEKVAPEVSKDYQELCRHHMQTKLSEKPEPLHAAARIGSVSAMEGAPVHSPSSRSSTSSWSEEPVSTSMDISTGHIVLSYMEDHLKNKDRLDEEWESLCSYEPEICSVKVASLPQNERKNRYSDILPYDHSRVVLHSATNVTGSDYINASTITDHDPRNPAYLVTQGPLPNTVADFWQMVWEQGSVVIVNLTRLTDQGNSLCHCYWPSEGSDLYHIYEVHLVSEHIWCEDYLVRSFYLRNLQTNETRTVTQFHFQTWPDMKTPGSSKALLDFRRKVNRSYRGRSCPVLIHCSDGAGRCGTYCLIDMVLNRMTKGAKEIDIAATLEHIRDQRMQMVKTKDQFQFVLATVAEEVHAILKALPQ